MIAARPPGFRHDGNAASRRSSAPNSSLTAIRRAWNTRVAGSIGGFLLPPGRGLGTQRRTNSASWSVVCSGCSRRVSTIRRAMRRLNRSSPYRQKRSAKSRSFSRRSSAAAVSPGPESSRMSSAAGRPKLKPRSAWSSWSEQTPRSANTPSTAATPSRPSTSGSSSKLAWTNVTGRPSSREAARANIEASRSRPIRRPVGPSRSASRRECPPAPTVASTKTCPGRGSSAAKTSSGKTDT